MGFFFSSEAATASEYAEFSASGGNSDRIDGANVIPAYVSLKNPLTLSGFKELTNGVGLRDRHGIGVDSLTRFFDDERDLLIRYAKQEKHDGILLEKDGHKLVVAFKPEQIKSAFNRGTWNRADPAILHQSACVVEPHVLRFSMDNRAQSSAIVREGSFSGMVLNVSSSGVVTQKINREGDMVRHDLYALSKPVTVGSIVDISYSKGVGLVGGKALAAGVGR